LIVIFNGPPRTGKDEAARYFKSFGFKHLSFKYQLFKETCAFFGVSEELFMNEYDIRSAKERPEVLLYGMSRRDALIYVSEEVIKPALGKDIFGVYVAREIEDGKNYCISDGGFAEELVPLINRVGADNIVLIQLTREGCDYSSDSRRYFNGRLVKEYTIDHVTEIIHNHILPQQFPIRAYRVHNNGSLEDFHHVLHDIYEKERNGQQTTTKAEFCTI
jgi:hypothetical protein